MSRKVTPFVSSIVRNPGFSGQTSASEHQDSVFAMPPSNEGLDALVDVGEQEFWVAGTVADLPVQMKHGRD